MRHNAGGAGLEKLVGFTLVANLIVTIQQGRRIKPPILNLVIEPIVWGEKANCVLANKRKKESK